MERLAVEFKVPLREVSESEARSAKKALWSYFPKLNQDEIKEAGKQFEIVLKVGVLYIYANFLDEWYLDKNLIIFHPGWILENWGEITLEDNFKFLGRQAEVFEIPSGMVKRIYDFDGGDIFYEAPRAEEKK